jgi:hypothetical protein
MTEAQRKVLNILDGQSDPLTSAEIAGMSNLTQIEVLKALGELQQTHSIIKGHAGYKLQGLPSVIPDDYQTVLKYLAGDIKARLPKTIRTELEWDEPRLKLVLRWGKSGGYLSMSEQGHYYITLNGVDLLKNCAPDFVVSAAVIHKIKNPTQPFTLIPEHELQERKRTTATEKNQRVADQANIHPAVVQAQQLAAFLTTPLQLPALPEPEVKIQILQVLVTTAGGHMQQQLKELLKFVQEATHATV